MACVPDSPRWAWKRPALGLRREAWQSPRAQLGQVKTQSCWEDRCSGSTQRLFSPEGLCEAARGVTAGLEPPRDRTVFTVLLATR